MNAPFRASLIFVAMLFATVLACSENTESTPSGSDVTASASPRSSATAQVTLSAVASTTPTPTSAPTATPTADTSVPDDIAELLANELDFSGAWSRRPHPEGGYPPQAKDEFPLDTELHYEEQLCVVRISGLGACRVAYWVYGADWLELRREGDATRSVDSSGREEFIVEYSGVYHHTHSFVGKTELPEELRRNDKDFRPTWDMSAGPRSLTFEFTGTISYSPERSEPLQARFLGTHQGELTFTHGFNIGMSYTGAIPEAGALPLNVVFREEVRVQEETDGLYRGSDQAYSGAFYSATVTPTGAITGVVLPQDGAERLGKATVEIFVPGQETPLDSSGIDADGKFTFTGLPLVRTDEESSGVSDVFASQYTIKVTNAEAEVDGKRITYASRTLTTRPFIEQTIYLESVPVTHFIAVGDRGVGGAPIVFHYSLEYWRCGGDFAPLHHTDGFTPTEIVAKCKELDPNAQPVKLGEVELLARTGWEVWAGVDDFTGSGRSWIQQSVWIAEIVYTGISAADLMPIFTGTEDEVTAKWAEIIAIAESYQWAEQSGFANGNTFTQWPMSMYKPLQTNSNTFIRYLVTTSGLTMTEMDGSHPGNLTPSQNTESDVGRDLTFYPTNTPWTGTASKPEPSGSPP